MANILVVKQPESDWEALLSLLAEQRHDVYLAEGRDVVPLGLLSLDIGLVITDRPDEWLEARVHGRACPPVVVCSNYYMVVNNPYDGHIIRRMLAERWGASEVRVFPGDFNPFVVAAAIEFRGC